MIHLKVPASFIWKDGDRSGCHLFLMLGERSWIFADFTYFDIHATSSLLLLLLGVLSERLGKRLSERLAPFVRHCALSLLHSRHNLAISTALLWILALVLTWTDQPFRFVSFWLFQDLDLVRVLLLILVLLAKRIREEDFAIQL